MRLGYLRDRRTRPCPINSWPNNMSTALLALTLLAATAAAMHIACPRNSLAKHFLHSQQAC